LLFIKSFITSFTAVLAGCHAASSLHKTATLAHRSLALAHKARSTGETRPLTTEAQPIIIMIMIITIITIKFGSFNEGFANNDHDDDNSIQFNSVLYFNVLTQQSQEPITESTKEDEIYT
jgi:hypothetical protein